MPVQVLRLLRFAAVVALALPVAAAQPPASGASQAGSCQPSWLPTSGSTPGTGGTVFAIAVYDDGSGGGAALYAGGNFATAGGVSASNIARWDGASWSPLGSGVNGHVYSLTVHDDGSGGGPALYAGGFFSSAGGAPANRIARWDGASWSPLGSGVDSAVWALAVLDDGAGGGPALYAGGQFTTAGGAPASRVAKWDGASWSPLGSGVSGTVRSLAVYDDGGGPALHTGGSFLSAGAVSASRIAKWDGASWSSLGSGMNGTVRALSVHDDGGGGGPALCAGGVFTTAGGAPANRVAKWDGASWSALGSGTNGNVHAVAAYDDGGGGGPALYAGGFFSSAGGVPASRIASWDGTGWSSLGSGTDGDVHALAVYDDGASGAALYAGGSFTTAGGVVANNLALWGACPAYVSYCTSGTSASGCQAVLSATGTASATAASGFVLQTTSGEGAKSGIFFFGTNGRQANPWGSGTSYQCVVPPVKRGGLRTSTGTSGACDGAFTQDLNARWCPTCPKPGHNPGPGAIVQAQLWYRDPLNTSNQTTSLSDAIEFSVAP